jgi:hypothetical protein
MSAQRVTLAGPEWMGDRAPGSELVRAPTARGWIAGKIQADGRGDLDAVHALQQAIRVTPLRAAAAPYTWPQGAVDSRMPVHPSITAEIEGMSAEQFFALFTEATRVCAPHAHDQPILARMRRVGIEPGRPGAFDGAAREARAAIESAAPVAWARIRRAAAHLGSPVNGWRANLDSIGTYGTSYLRRAAVAYTGLDASTPEDAVCYTVCNDARGMPLQSDSSYRLCFDADGLPPVRAFWSLTMYDHRHHLAGNLIDRCAIGSRDPIAYNSDGSLELCIQRRSPGDRREHNWLPTPEHGPFSMILRLHWPTHAILDGLWQPPRIRRANDD